MYRYFILLITLSGVLLAQEKPTSIFIEHNSFIVDSQQVEYISYKIPFENLLFTKSEEHYTASFTLTLEFYKDEEFIHREITSPSFEVENYDETTSSEKFFENLIEFKLEPGEYKLKPLLSLEGANVEYKIPELDLIVDTLTTSQIISPLIVLDTNKNDTSKLEFVLTNFGGKIPYSHNNYSLILGVRNSLNSFINISIVQFDKVIFKDSLNSISTGNTTISKKGKSVVVSLDKTGSVKLYQISNFSHLLSEGIAKFKIYYGKTEKEFALNIKWINKPKVLKNPEYSIKLLSYIEDENVVGELLSNDSDLYYEKLSEYWRDKYPANGMKYNYAMNEYYTRADYAVEKLSSLNSFDGAERDRGKIYITYGEPSSIERNYTERNEIVEYWNYETVERTFVFKDINGTGKFDLVD